MLIPLAVMNLPWVILGQVSKTLLTSRTHLAQEQLEATRVLFCRFDRREEETPSPSEATGWEVGGTHGPRCSGKPGDQGRPVSILRGPAVSRGVRGDSAELPQLPDTPASASRRCRNKPPQTERHSTRKVSSCLQTWETRVLGSAGPSGGLWTRSPSLRLPPPSSRHAPSCFRQRLGSTASIYIRFLCVDSTCIT